MTTPTAVEETTTTVRVSTLVKTALDNWCRNVGMSRRETVNRAIAEFVARNPVRIKPWK